MKKSVSLPTTTNNTPKSSKVSFSDRLLMGEDIESIVNEDETPTTAENISQPIETIETIETPIETIENIETPIETIENIENIETPIETIENIETPIETIETPAQRAERGTVKRATLELFRSLQNAGINQENWAQIAVDRGICKNVRQAANILRYDFLQIVRIPLDGTTTKTKMTSLEAREHYNTTKEAAKVDLFNSIANAKKAYFEKVGKSYNCLKVSRKNEAETAAESVKKAGEVLKSLESIDTSKVELTPEMRAMMLKMLGMEAV